MGCFVSWCSTGVDDSPVGLGIEEVDWEARGFILEDEKALLVFWEGGYVCEWR